MNLSLQQRIAEMLDAHFRHGIGDIVVHKQVLASVRAEILLNPSLARRKQDDPFATRLGVPHALTVVGRRLEQCHGGIQGFYVVRDAHRMEGNAGLTIVGDHEVVTLDAAMEVYLADIEPKKEV